jgi:hypothetical protein
VTTLVLATITLFAAVVREGVHQFRHDKGPGPQPVSTTPAVAE